MWIRTGGDLEGHFVNVDAVTHIEVEHDAGIASARETASVRIVAHMRDAGTIVLAEFEDSDREKIAVETRGYLDRLASALDIDLDQDVRYAAHTGTRA